MKLEDSKYLQSKGIILPHGMELMRTRGKHKGRHLIDEKGTMALAMDSAATLTANTAGPAMFYNVLSPNVVSILFKAMRATELLPLRKEGSFGDETLNIRVREFTGGTSAYNDFSNGISSDVNDSYPVRAQYRYKTMIMYGDLEVQKATARRVALAAEKQESAAYNMAQTENKIYLYGVKDLKVYGLLNDPNLNSPINALNATVNGEQKTKWTDKDKDPVGVANHIANDVLALYQELVSNNGAHIDPTTEMTLALSEKRVPFLSRANNYGNTVMSIIKETIPNLKVVTLPEASLSSGENMYLICSQVNGQDAGYLAFSEKLIVSPVIQMPSYQYQTYSAGSWGCVITQPSLIASMTGI